MASTLQVVLSASVLATISSPLNQQPVFFRDSKARVTNNNSRDRPSRALVVADPKPLVVVVVPSIEQGVETMTRAQGVPAPLMILMLLV